MEENAIAAIAMLRDGMKNLDFRRVAKASRELARVEVLDSTHGIELSKTVERWKHWRG
jgi:hypothetical protein